jgi:hypothetical protein
MKKILLTTAIASSLFAVGAYANQSTNSGPAKTGLVISGEGSWSSFNGMPTGWGTGNGLGLGAYVGYDYAINNSFTIGAKTGYSHSFNVAKTTSGPDMSAATDNIPLLATAKYYLTPKVYLGGELGINFQRVTVFNMYSSDWTATNNWNPSFMFGGLVGYNINDKMSVSGSIDYITGNDASKVLPVVGGSSANDAMSNMKLGVQFNYLLPM